MTIEPDAKDWTWVLDRPCPECGFDSTVVRGNDLPELIHDNTRRWSVALAAHDVTIRPSPSVWSPLEYACHVRDVHRLFDQRVALMLAEDGPAFENWDQDATAVAANYPSQDPQIVEVELIEAAASVAGRYALVTGPSWRRTGRRSDGTVFSVESLGRYHLHDVAHHLYDVGS